MAGLLGEATMIASLADDWDKHLGARHPGAIGHFKMYEATSLRGEFAHWHRRNAIEKIRQMAGVIDRSDLVEVSAVLDLAAFQRVFTDWDGASHDAFNQPYIMLAQFILASSVTVAIGRGTVAPIEIVFDEHDVFRPVIQSRYGALRAFIADTEPQRAAVMPLQPWFRNDRDFAALQAADLLAGDVRLSAEKDPLTDEIGVLCPRLRSTSVYAELDEERLQRFKQTAGI
jgi:hypothetical protein